MIENKKLAEISKNLVTNDTDFMEAFRKNVSMYLKEKELTIAELAEISGISFDTLKTFLYKNVQDAKLSNAIKLAKTLNVSLDELVGADTIHELTKESLAMCRNLPENDLYLVRWFIRYLTSMNEKTEPNKRYISVMMPKQTNNGDFEVTSDYEKVEITDLKEPLRSKVFAGFHIICDHYMPYYKPGDIILIANDRPQRFSEHSVVRAGKYLFIVNRVVENGIAKYYSIRDGKYRIDEKEVDELIGYIANVKKKSQ